jgi:glutamyl-tRNA synthetase
MNAEQKPVRVRIAPSPTGNLHVGTARAALFNELFARKNNGTFIVRMEDTDPKRSKKEFEDNIIEGLTWLGITWDEGPDKRGKHGPYRQSERADLYREALEQLLKDKKAYVCMCEPAPLAHGERYTCECHETDTVPAAGQRTVVRLKVEPQEVTFHDIVRGDVTVHNDSFGGDFVIARSLDNALYHLAVVVDDALMKISHVIRGEDPLHNTIKHILLQRALGYEQPVYAHLPLLLDEQRKKLSKRSGETSLLAYKDMGYLPEAMLNYLALLGWGAPDDRELFSHEELIKTFSLERVQKSGAIFSVTKLQSMNKQYIKQLGEDELFERTRPFLEQAGISLDDTDLVKRALVIEQERVATLAELPEAIQFFLPDWQPDYPVELLVWRKSNLETTQQLLQQLLAKIEEISNEDFSEENLQEQLMTWIDEQQLGRGDTLWPMRVALTGREHSPGPFEVAAILGKGETVQRLGLALEKFV